MSIKNLRNSKSNKNIGEALLFGKVPPQATDLEGAILGAIMIDPPCLYKVKSIISTPDMLYKTENELIYKAILQLDQMQLPIDFMVVCETLRKNGELEQVGGSYYVTGLTKDVVRSDNVEVHARIIAQYYFRREMIRICADTINASYDESNDTFDIMDNFETSMYTSRYILTAGSNKTFESKVREVVVEINDPNKRKNFYVSTGFKHLDEKLGGGFIRGTVTILAARTSMGKTSFVISCSGNQSKEFPVAIWNGELSQRRFIMRQISHLEKITISEMNKFDVPDETLDRINSGASILMSDHKMFTDETTPILLEDLIAKIRYWVMCCGVQCIYLDYLRYINLPDGFKYDKLTEQQKIAHVVGRLNAVAKEMDVPIVLIQQLNRETEKNAGKEPTLANLRDAGALEEMVACVLFLYRPEYYGIKETEDQKSTKDVGLVLIRKNGDNQNPVDVSFKTEAKYFTWHEEEPEYGKEIIDGSGYTYQNVKDLLNDEEVPF